MSNLTSDVANAVYKVKQEIFAARDRFAPFNTAHEGYAVLLEEVDELKAHVWTKQGSRDVEAMKKEAIQVAAMAICFVIECGQK